MGGLLIWFTQIIIYGLLAAGFYFYLIYFKNFDNSLIVITLAPILVLFGFLLLVINKFRKERQNEKTMGLSEQTISINYRTVFKIDIATVLLSFLSLITPILLDGKIGGANVIQAGLLFIGMYLVKRILLLNK